MTLDELLNEQFSPNLPEGVKMRTSERGNTIALSLISVPEEQRGSGIFQRLIDELLSYADSSGKTVTLTASNDFGANKSRLEKFYMSKGFVKNTGKNKDYEISDGMYRTPRTIKEGKDYDKNPSGPEIKIPIYTQGKFDFGEKANKIQRGDIVLKASDTGNIYGRRRTAQRKPKKTSSKKWIK